MSTRRPRKTANQWEKLVDQQISSGMSIAEFCKQHDVALSTFSKWHRRFKVNTATAKNAFKQVKTLQPSATPAPASQGSVISVQVGHNILLTIRSGESLS